ncbi:hypothetical protein CU037_2126 [Enterococcus faecium]|nr:hypothetical protein [Enterococcus faecium]MBK4833039.1 hypothetical protein [Enterococcus faecium]MBK4851686.1 hypothetical protein [Enterococcus faecium]
MEHGVFVIHQILRYVQKHFIKMILMPVLLMKSLFLVILN